METINITPENIGQLNFKGIELRTQLNGGFDSDDENSHKIDLTFKLNGGGEVVEYLLDRATAALRIKVNTPNGPIKGKAVDAETYQQYLEANDFSFTFDVAELMELKRTPATPESQLSSAAKKMLDAGTINQTQYEAIMATLK